MRRRQVLTAAALSAASLAGCSGSEPPEESPTDEPTDTSSPTDTDTDAVTPDPDDPILFVVSNGTDTERTVSLTLTRTDQTFVDESLTLAPGDSRELDSRIRSPGDYELAVTVENGPQRTMTLAIGSYDVRMGSNHFVDVGADGINVYWEE
ncbi:hypothetical protein EGH21_01840 [Halomicroarcula sp. F13]|uniref:Ig-like domain-containing protein n=1 Tax=Haloarcula rubra TaxID=2487747 RepID=A0AAW4PNF9_9EURY|nr:hypothetical protein [Halomicroarcula rubra]MBX0321764.1 hypothetical protein [Halomicroarcula rubra]